MNRLVIALFVVAGCSNKWKDNEGNNPQNTDDTAVDTALGPHTGDSEVDTGDPIDNDGDGSFAKDDCDDSDDTVYPGADELCDGKDNDCDTSTDGEGDDDGDGLLDCEDACPVWVDQAAAAGGDGTFTRPFQVVQEGIDFAPSISCTEVRVRAGTYVENIDFNGYNLDVLGVDGAGDTTLDGDANGSVVTFANGEGPSARIAGFTITNGLADRGAGIYVLSAAPTIEDNVITGNVASGTWSQGGGIYLEKSDATIQDNEISSNDAGYGGVENGSDGGAIFAKFGSPVIQRNQLVDNTAGDGGAIWIAYADALIVQNEIAGNLAMDSDTVKGGQGGGIDIQIGTDNTLVSGNFIWGNSASTHGGGVAIYEYNSGYGDPSLVNNTIVGNTVGTATNGDQQGAGLCIWTLTSPIVTNNAITHNDGPGVFTYNENATISYNDVWGNTVDWDGDRDATGVDGNIEKDPLYKNWTDDGDWTNDNLDPKGSSPLKDAGSPSITDTDGSISDIGATGGPYGL